MLTAVKNSATCGMIRKSGGNVPPDAEFTVIGASHQKLLPTTDLKPVPYNKDRILRYNAATGRANWEGEGGILPGSPIPNVED